MQERFQPITHFEPITYQQKILFRIRLLFDFQTNTIYRDLKVLLKCSKGKILDVGCGNSPFKHLLDNSRTQYYGLDIEDSFDFNYHRTDITYFNGNQIPFEDNYFDSILCTEVLEHVPNPLVLVNEMYRVLKSDGKIILTVPFSARYHYIPHDYYRYTPSSLMSIFSHFDNIKIEARGTDITVIGSKIIVVFFRQILNMRKIGFQAILSLIIFITGLPFLFLSLLAGHLSLILNAGSKDDCLGYTLTANKS